MHNYTIILHILGGRTLKYHVTRPENLEKYIELLDRGGWYIFLDQDGRGFTRINSANVLYIDVREEIEADNDGE